MRATLDFDLNDSDDLMAHLRCVKALDMGLAIWDIIYDVRKKIEVELETNKSTTQAEFDLHEKIFEKIFEVLDEKGIKIDDLIN